MKKLHILFLFSFLVLLLSCHSKTEKKKVNDVRFAQASDVLIDAYTPDDIENLTVLGQVWGFLKYYHPIVMKGNYNWDSELFGIMPAILKASSIDERNQLLCRWVQSLGTFSKKKNNRKNSGGIKLEPDLEWLSDKERLGEELSALLLQVAEAERKEKSYYVALVQSVKNPQFTNEAPYSSLCTIDVGYRLLSLFRYWNIIEYFFPNRHLIGEDWHAVLKESVPLFIDAHNLKAYKLETLKLIARIHDTHANLWSDPKIKCEGDKIVPVCLQFVEDKLIVVDKDSCYPLVSLERGDVITEIDGEPVDSIVVRLIPYYPASNKVSMLRDMAEDLLITFKDMLPIKYERDGLTFRISVPAYLSENVNIPVKNGWRKENPSVLPDNIGYIYCESILNDSLPSAMEKVKNTKGLILDLRCYPRDFLVFTLTTYIVPHKTPFVKFSTGSLTEPGLFTITPCLSVGQNSKKDIYKGQIIILVDETTQSRAEYTTMAFRVAPNAKVVGSQTAGADGNVSEIILPGGLRTMISGIGIYTPDGEETQRIGIVPDIEVKPTIKGIREGRDELMEKAIELIKTTG